MSDVKIDFEEVVIKARKAPKKVEPKAAPKVEITPGVTVKAEPKGVFTEKTLAEMQAGRASLNKYRRV